MNGIHGSSDGMHLSNTQNSISMHHLHHHPHGISNGDAMNGHGNEHVDGGHMGNVDGGHMGNVDVSDGMVEGNIVVEGNILPDQGDLSNDHHGMVFADHSIEHGDQLTLSFQGKVFVFDSVSPEKVQAVLLLLGGSEVPPGTSSIPLSTNHNSKAQAVPQRLSVPQRLASLNRFREKRKERNFDKKIRYAVRKEVALRMQRNKGQFTSSKPNNDDSASAVTSWASNETWASESNGSHHPEAVCRHCGTSEKSTPMMRRGPEGPRTLCNACGLMWANKGTLRDLSKAAPHIGQSSSSLNRAAENGTFEANERVRVTENGDDSS